MSNLGCITICIIVSFVTTAIFMSVFKAEYKSDKNFIYSIIREHWSLISSHSDSIDILRARVTDLECESEIKKLDNK